MSEATIIAAILALTVVIVLLAGWCSDLEQRITKLERERKRD